MNVKKYTLLMFLSVLCFQTYSSSVWSKLIPKNASLSREAILGGLLKGMLEKVHFSKKKLNKSISEKAFKEYVQRIDYGKQFLLQKDVDALSKFKYTMHEQLISGNLQILNLSKRIMNQRIKEIKAYAGKFLSNPLDYSIEEAIETDPKKRKHLKSMKKLKDLWRRNLKFEVMRRFSNLKDDQDGTSRKAKSEAKKAKRKGTKKKVVKKKTEKKLWNEAREKVAKSYAKIFKRILEEKRTDQLNDFYNSIARIYDPHTNYLPPEEKEDFDIDMSGKLEGIGAVLSEDGSYIKVERIVPGSASWKGKELKEGDLILKVAQADDDPVDVVDMPLREAVRLIRGPKDSEVRLTVKKPSGIVKTISIIRDIVTIEDGYVKGSVIKSKKLDKKIGYIYVPKFYRDFSDINGRNCSADVKAELIKLKKQNVDALILDLRNNGGGALEDARIMSGLFIKDGPIVQVKNHIGKTEILKDTDKSIVFDKPMVVLINRHSASASEIVAAALQDYGRAVIIGGDHSHGKGTVQTISDLNQYVTPVIRSLTSMGALKITIQKFYRVNGGSTQYKGVTPDIIFPDKLGYLETGEQYLDYSLPWDQVKEVKHDHWTKTKANIPMLTKSSNKRIAQSKKFRKITESVNWFKAKKEDSVRKLSLKEFKKNKTLLKQKSEEFEIKIINKDLTFTSTEKLKRDIDKEKYLEVKENLGKDPYVEETINILNDMLSSKKISKK